MNGTCTGTIFWVPTPWGRGEGPKCQISLNLNLQSQFQRFLYQTLPIFLQTKDIYNIRRDIYSALWVMPRGGTWGTVGGWGIKKFFFCNSIRFKV